MIINFHLRIESRNSFFSFSAPFSPLISFLGFRRRRQHVHKRAIKSTNGDFINIPTELLSVICIRCKRKPRFAPFHDGIREHDDESVNVC